MCCASEQIKDASPIPLSPFQTDFSQLADIDMNCLTVETEDTFASLLELAANDDIEGFKRWIKRDPSAIDEVGLWYGRQKGSKQMILEDRTPLMVAATYGSLDVLSLILSLSEADVNQSCGLDKTTALHCAASSGSLKSIDIVKLLLLAGADPNLIDANGHRAADVILVSPKFQDMKLTLGELLANDGSDGINDLRVSRATSNSNPSLVSLSPENRSPSSASDSTSSPNIATFDDLNSTFAAEKKEYPVDPSLPDIKNGIYSTDEFRMFSFKVRPCSRAYSHDWTECPFVHPGENARRRDPRKYHYSCVPCPDFRKGACRRGDMCEYAHGVFECWLHPAQYRTRLCKDGISCNRRVCFFAHKHEELRPLYISTGSAVPSPRSSTTAANGMDFAAAMSLLPSSPSSVCAISSSPFTPPMSPSNGLPNMGWHQANVPTLQLPGSNLQSSRLRSSLNARDIHAEDMNLLQDFDVQQHQLLHEFSRLSQPNVSANSLNRSVRSRTLTPSNLEDLFSSESLSPRYSDQTLASSVFSPRQNTSILNQFHQQQSMLSPINTNISPNKVDNPLLQNSYAAPLGRMSPRNMEPISPMSSRVSTFAQHEQQHQFRSLSSRELGSSSSFSVGSPGDSWPKWGSSKGNAEWNVNNKDFGQLKRSASFEADTNEEEPDLSWVQSLVKESHHEANQDSGSPVSGAAGTADASFSNSANLNSRFEPTDQSVLGAWIEQMQLDQMLAQ